MNLPEFKIAIAKRNPWLGQGDSRVTVKASDVMTLLEHAFEMGEKQGSKTSIGSMFDDVLGGKNKGTR